MGGGRDKKGRVTDSINNQEGKDSSLHSPHLPFLLYVSHINALYEKIK